MKKINDIAYVKNTLLLIILFWQTSLSAHTVTGHLIENTDNQIKEVPMANVAVAVNKVPAKSIQIEMVKLTDNSGLTYIGGKVNPADLELYLSQMKKLLGDDFSDYRQHQKTRDHNAFHMTLINPYEYQLLTKETALGATYSIALSGLGRVDLEEKTTFFVVVQSKQAADYRQNLDLNVKDFHITLGFSPSDIYGVSKGIETLVK